ncbi:uncharacterized protein LOC120350398 isoform X1 [Nilaparvata lugens]|uniref:uncharacterized protein LOC120350398 isoform X1 n=1 Tax=Nilaparvata lugens TaxID=108931 RepID=UPI00193CFE68|nr:uncharacterized protein LOC120350398 isoform X1 [Nilaparvata lugens]
MKLFYCLEILIICVLVFTKAMYADERMRMPDKNGGDKLQSDSLLERLSRREDVDSDLNDYQQIKGIRIEPTLLHESPWALIPLKGVLSSRNTNSNNNNYFTPRLGRMLESENDYAVEKRDNIQFSPRLG